jgi:hypothetical protein
LDSTPHGQYEGGVLAFIDESGDPGLKLGAGSSKLFAVAIVVFVDAESATECDRAIGALRRDLGLPERFEIRFARNRDHVRRKFLETVGPHQFHSFVTYVDKATLDPSHARKKGELYQWTMSEAVQLAGPFLRDATVVIDAAGDRDFRNEVAAYLRRTGGRQPRIRKLKLDRSDRNNLLQLADYIVGVAARALAGEPAAVELRALVESGRLTIRRQT